MVFEVVTYFLMPKKGPKKRAPGLQAAGLQVCHVFMPKKGPPVCRLPRFPSAGLAGDVAVAAEALEKHRSFLAVSHHKQVYYVAFYGSLFFKGGNNICIYIYMWQFLVCSLTRIRRVKKTICFLTFPFVPFLFFFSNKKCLKQYFIIFIF